MARPFLCLFVVVAVLRGVPAAAQHTPPESELRELQFRSGELSAQVSALLAPLDTETREQRQVWADVAVRAKAAEWMLRHEEFPRPEYQQQLRNVLAEGTTAANALKQSVASASDQDSAVFGYVSRIDGSVQPYAVLCTPDQRQPRSGPWPLHVVLHGRADQMNEVNFIARYGGTARKPAEDQNWIQLDVYGRGNNAYRWAGETDVFEAIEDVRRRFRIDDNRITLHGFSMGGAGAWHLGLHYPDIWCSVGPGAGFVDFYRYQKRDEPLPPWQHATLGVYDAVEYALNAANVPICTYGGELDPQLAASLTIAEAVASKDVALKVIVGPGMGHKFDPESRSEFMEFHREHSASGRPGYLQRRSIRFTTRTLKYNRCDWVTIEEMEVPYQPATIEARMTEDGDVEISTSNVTAFRVFRDVGTDAVIDGIRLPCRSAADGLLPDVSYQIGSTGWEVLDYESSRAFTDNPDLHKRHNLQGPIDDAFMEPFLCVVGTGTPWNPAAHAWALQELERFRKTHDKWMRGAIRVIEDSGLTEELMQNRNLILFGDPGSNSVLAKCLPDLPISWTRDAIGIGGQQWSAGEFVPNLIYPNPFQPRRYVVVNSGMTVRDVDFRASNAWLFPKLGDVAVRRIDGIRTDPGIEDCSDVVWASIFDANWKLTSPEAVSARPPGVR